MRRRLQADLREVRNRIPAALRHLFNLLQDEVVVIVCKRCACEERDNGDN